jgi:high affinity Mn2+ porin
MPWDNASNMPGRLPNPLLAAALLCLGLQCVSAWAQEIPASVRASQDTQQAADPDTLSTIFPHTESGRYWVSGQMNFILQWHPSFPAPYSGPNSLRPGAEHALSQLYTLFTGYQLTQTTEILFAPESTGGHGLSDALGLAGFTNLDVVRNPGLGASPYISRLMIHQIIPLSSERVPATRGPLSLATELPARRLEIRLGKFSLVESFDLNSVGADSHLQFMNWTVDNNGAYDYAANTRGYTDGIILEFQDRRWTARYAETLMPKVANGIQLDANVFRARAENFEFEIRRSVVPHRNGTLRLLGYVNHANMGSYRAAVNSFLAGKTGTPDITAHPLQTTIKYGLGVNFEQQLNNWLTAYGRWGWNEGQHESFAYTEVDQTAALGAGFDGKLWQRRLDRVGATVVSNGISRDHQLYLALGGKGFLLGDGRLTYGRENIFESYYTAHLWRGVFASMDLQHINNPGYNRDRGPVVVPGLRLHVEF